MNSRPRVIGCTYLIRGDAYLAQSVELEWSRIYLKKSLINIIGEDLSYTITGRIFFYAKA